MNRTTDQRRANAAIILLGVVCLATIPIWIVPAVVWMIATGRNPKRCGEESNQESEE